jgi:flagellar hook-associated protein 1 FlgK
MSVSELAAGLSSTSGEQFIRFEAQSVSASARSTVLRDTELAKTGVDTDAELQKLLVIEQAYAANARVIQTVGEMVDQLLRL